MHWNRNSILKMRSQVSRCCTWNWQVWPSYLWVKLVLWKYKMSQVFAKYKAEICMWLQKVFKIIYHMNIFESSRLEHVAFRFWKEVLDKNNKKKKKHLLFLLQINFHIFNSSIKNEPYLLDFPPSTHALNRLAGFNNLYITMMIEKKNRRYWFEVP